MKDDNNLTVRINTDIIEQFDKEEMLVISGGKGILGLNLCFGGDSAVKSTILSSIPAWTAICHVGTAMKAILRIPICQ